MPKPKYPNTKIARNTPTVRIVRATGASQMTESGYDAAVMAVVADDQTLLKQVIDVKRGVIHR